MTNSIYLYQVIHRCFCILLHAGYCATYYLFPEADDDPVILVTAPSPFATSRFSQETKLMSLSRCGAPFFERHGAVGFEEMLLGRCWQKEIQMLFNVISDFLL